jgi:hypothetical protein
MKPIGKTSTTKNTEIKHVHGSLDNTHRLHPWTEGTESMVEGTEFM